MSIPTSSIQANLGDFPVGVVADPSVAREATQVVAMTREIFGEPVSLVRQADPEDDGDYFVVSAVAASDTQDNRARSQAWHHRLALELAPANRFALSLRYS